VVSSSIISSWQNINLTTDIIMSILLCNAKLQGLTKPYSLLTNSTYIHLIQLQLAFYETAANSVHICETCMNDVWMSLIFHKEKPLLQETDSFIQANYSYIVVRIIGESMV